MSLIHPPPEFFPSGRVVAAFSLRDPDLPDRNNMSFGFGNPAATQKNREEFLSSLGLSVSSLTLAVQEHGVGVLRVDRRLSSHGARGWEDALPGADGLVTDLPGCPVGVLVADCCCLLMADRDGEVVGAFHAGWRGTLEGMAARGVQSFRDWFGVSPERVKAWIGPAICGDCFRVGQEVWDLFVEKWPGNHLAENPYRVDLAELNRLQLIESGVPTSSVVRTRLCTLEESKCFSHRSDDRREGRMLGIVAIRA